MPIFSRVPAGTEQGEPSASEHVRGRDRCRVDKAVHETMLERQREGFAEAKRQSRYKRRLPTALRQSAEIVRLKQEGVTPMEIAGKLGIGRASVYRVLAGQNASDRTAA